MLKKIKELGNVILMYPVEGFEEFTDARRGKGVFNKVLTAMDLMREEMMPFGYSCCVSRENVKEVLNDDFVNLMVEKGALVGWYFLYMPVGGGADINHMPLPEQRLLMKERIAEIRKNKPLFVIDFWNDAPYVGGCIAGGRYYCHINHHGDVEPCIFIHFATDNIKNLSLDQALNSPFFRDIRSKQPFDQNLFLPCQIIDHPDILVDICKTFKPYTTCPGADEVITKLHPCLMEYSKKVRQIYEPVWEEYKREADKEKIVKE